jgi:hypothetical protein
MPEKFLGPSVANVSFPGCAFANAMSSGNVLAARSRIGQYQERTVGNFPYRHEVAKRKPATLSAPNTKRGAM